VVAVYDDAAISGASTLNRPGLLRLIADAQARKFDVIITESLDRLSRSQADIGALYERLQFLGVRIETLADGAVSEIHVGLKGTETKNRRPLVIGVTATGRSPRKASAIHRVLGPSKVVVTLHACGWRAGECSRDRARGTAVKHAPFLPDQLRPASTTVLHRSCAFRA
jgi:Resolvase, N terminal domain